MVFQVEAPVRVNAPVKLDIHVSCFECADQQHWVVPTLLAGAFALAKLPLFAAVFGTVSVTAVFWSSGRRVLVEAVASIASLSGRTQQVAGRDGRVLDITDPAVRAMLQEKALSEVTLKGPLRIAVVGRRGVGKSTWINSLRKLKPHDTGAAKVGVDQMLSTQDRTSKASRYHHAGMVLEEIPECDCMVMGSEHIDRFKLNAANACILFYTSVIEPRLLEGALRLHEEHQVPVFLVRNKVGTDCRNEVEDGNAESLQEAFADIQRKAGEQICAKDSRFAPYACLDRLFLIEASYSDAMANPPQEDFQSEFQRLKSALEEGRICHEAKHAQLRAIFAEGSQTADVLASSQ